MAVQYRLHIIKRWLTLIVKVDKLENGIGAATPVSETIDKVS